jgi:phosphoribosylglycinamide formyltransferase-1
LAGFLWKIPERLIQLFPNKIINIHPALLPNYGGKGMYGHFVHEAVINSKETKSGITIHYVNEHYDEGDYIFQAECEVTSNDTPETLADKIHQLEFAHFPQIIKQIIQ